MATKKLLESRIDFDAISAALGKVKPSTLTMNDVLERLRPAIERHVQRGLTVQQVRSVLVAEGVDVSASALTGFLRGKVPADAAAPPRSRTKRSPKSAGDGTAPGPDAPPPTGGSAAAALGDTGSLLGPSGSAPAQT